MKRRMIALFFCAVFALALTACGAEPVATVNGEKISRESYEEYVTYMMSMYGIGSDYDLSSDMGEMLQSQAIQSLVYMEEVKQACEKENCAPSAKEIDEYCFEMLGVEDKKAYSEAVSTIQTQYGLSEDTLRMIIASDLYSEKLGDALAKKEGVEVSDDEAKAKYEEAPEEYDNRTVSHILISPEAADGREPETDESGNAVYTDEEWAAAEAEAKELIKELDGGADFAELAKDHSDDTASAANGGALDGSFTAAASSYVEEFTAASFELTEEGQYTKEPVKSSYGYHIILCTGLQDADHDFDQLVETIKTNLLNEQKQTLVSDYMEQFEEESEIVINYGPDATDDEAAAEDDDAAADEGDDSAAADSDDSADDAADDGEATEE